MTERGDHGPSEAKLASATVASARARAWKRFVPLGAVAAFAVAVWVLQRTLRDVDPAHVMAELSRLPSARVIASCAFTALAYASLTGYDALGVRYIGRTLRYPQIALTSFIAYGFSNNFAVGGIASTTLRYRLYSAWGLSALDVVRIFLFTSATLWIGYCAIAGAAFTFMPIEGARLGSHSVSPRMLGVALLAALVAFGLWSAARRRPLTIRGLELPLPGPRMLLSQLAVSTLDWGFSAAALFVLFPRSAELTFAGFVGVYLLAQVIAAISHVPGGLGVFESAMVLLLAPEPYAAETVLGCLLAFRGIYYLGPLLLAALALVIRELAVRWRGA